MLHRGTREPFIAAPDPYVVKREDVKRDKGNTNASEMDRAFLPASACRHAARTIS
jgi:hypothetical protein